MKVFEPSLLEKAPAGFKATDYKAKEYPGWKFVIQVVPDDCTGCGLCVDVCPAKDKTQVKHKAIDMEPKIPTSTASGPAGTSSSRSPTSIARRSSSTRSRARSSCCPCSSSPGPRRLRRDALHQAHHAIVRRPDADRQRHRLLVDLRRQPALHALHADAGGQGAGVVELAVRGTVPAAVLRVPLIMAPSFLSTDVNRYVWDGRVQAAGNRSVTVSAGRSGAGNRYAMPRCIRG